MHDDSEAGVMPLSCPDCDATVSNEDDVTDRTLHCPDCDTAFRLLLVPIGRDTSAGCPTCGGDLVMDGFGGPLTCESCGEEWTIRERSWLDPATHE
ncbi:hypothetical protein HTIA_1012 [Halorhabdus tiamatea SARL4B]|uniref:Uncharacterized protein n=1 Tax=Halorhabdus tiamatea SARL4B TaxID=1033806 RepID=F7PGA6_9EURY|nr:hypothetical protein HTIA_1012 [Halorhabdus tiamatea SARL4B]